MSDTLVQIPLTKLSASPLNVRKKDRKADIDTLAASILAHGLLQNLNVVLKGEDRYEVVAGGRRLKEQVRAIGPTRLDRILSGVEEPLDGKGRLASAETTALQQRRMYLIERGIMGVGDDKLGGQALPAMVRTELDHAARRASQELGVPVITQMRTSIEGVYP